MFGKTCYKSTKNVKVAKVRGLGGKLGDQICEIFQVRTMYDLSKVSLLNLRRHFEEKTTTWLYNLARGIDHEEVTERQLPQSIGCGKNFRGPEILDTNVKIEAHDGPCTAYVMYICIVLKK